MDHVGGVAKTTLRRAIGAGVFFRDLPHMVQYLQEEFSEKAYPKYKIMELEKEKVQDARDHASRKIYGTVPGTSKFRAILFTPNSTTIKASNKICICKECEFEYATCSLFQEFEIPVTTLKTTQLRLCKGVEQGEGAVHSVTSELIQPGSVYAVAPSSISTYPV